MLKVTVRVVSLFLTTSLLTPAQANSASEAELSAARTSAAKVFKERVSPFINTYCFECHGDKKQKGGISFRYPLKNPSGPAFTKQWKQAAASVKAHDMPPEDASKQPSPEEARMFSDWVASIKFLSPKDPGLFVIRRLNRVEYANTLHDLLGERPSAALELPDEVLGAGYLNSFSPLVMEQYLAIANELLDRVLASEGTSPTPLQIRIFGPQPTSAAQERTAALEAVRSIARRAYRRPASEPELRVLMDVFDLAKSNGRSHYEALRLTLKAILVSPQFLFITPNVDIESKQDVVPLDDHQLASRLSYLLWSTMPDEELAALADNATLSKPEVLSAQIKRLLADPRSRALFDGFGAQWLGVDKLASKTFDSGKFPEMNDSLRTAMYDEARLLFESLIRNNESLVKFLDCEYTFLNEPLAALYGLETQVKGSAMRKVALTDSNRGGILTMPAVLAATSLPNRTSPVIRGVWVLEQILGEHVPPPPPNVPTLEKQDKIQVANLTLRQRTELHRTNAACANCHKTLDPIGFGLENFDPIGRWRMLDENGAPIDSSGELPEQKHFSSPRELKALIAGRAPDFCRNLTEKLLAYALCRQLEGYDEIVVDSIVDAVVHDQFRMQTLITKIVTSYPFMYRRVQEPKQTPNEKKLVH